MTITLEPQEEARLVAAAEAKGISTETLVREALDPLLRSPSVKTDSRSVWEIFADNRKGLAADAFDDLPTDGASEHDHYLYGSPKRNQ